jgi:Protein of unknown function (DUF3631)
MLALISMSRDALSLTGGLAQRLKGYGIKSHTIRVGEVTARGYEASDFADAGSRYLSDERYKRHKRHIFDNKNNFVSDVSDVSANIEDEELEPAGMGALKSALTGDGDDNELELPPSSIDASATVTVIPSPRSAIRA